MEVNSESLLSSYQRARRIALDFCPYTGVRMPCRQCAYSVNAPSEVLESFCVFSSIYRPSSQFRSWFYAR